GFPRTGTSLKSPFVFRNSSRSRSQAICMVAHHKTVVVVSISASVVATIFVFGRDSTSTSGPKLEVAGSSESNPGGHSSNGITALAYFGVSTEYQIVSLIVG